MYNLAYKGESDPKEREPYYARGIRPLNMCPLAQLCTGGTKTKASDQMCISS